MKQAINRQFEKEMLETLDNHAKKLDEMVVDKRIDNLKLGKTIEDAIAFTSCGSYCGQ